VDGIKDTIYTTEAILAPPLNLFGIYAFKESYDLTLQSGLKGLPKKNTTFTVTSDNTKQPTENEMTLSFYTDSTKMDYYAIGGTVSYIVTTEAKTVRFSNLQFKAENGDTRTISFEVKLK
jgi:hypothetical protein